MSKVDVLKQFKKGIISFLDELISQFPQEGDLVVMRVAIKDQIPVEMVMKDFIEIAGAHRDRIKSRDESFFLNNSIQVPGLPSDKHNHLKKVWRSDALDDEDKEAIWKWVDSFLFLADKYLVAKD